MIGLQSNSDLLVNSYVNTYVYINYIVYLLLFNVQSVLSNSIPLETTVQKRYVCQLSLQYKLTHSLEVL